ncbi:antitoxin VapB family protein [Candidatus Micrarchaeota archaeon]|nr:antitoxin VapB family protein [Candidatus Micrarchaeota archaeon]
MVKVITIMDDVYAELYRIKRSKGLSFSGVIRYLMEEKEKESKNIISLAGSINDEDLDRKAMEGIKKGMHEWGKYV